MGLVGGQVGEGGGSAYEWAWVALLANAAGLPLLAKRMEQLQ